MEPVNQRMRRIRQEIRNIKNANIRFEEDELVTSVIYVQFKAPDLSIYRGGIWKIKVVFGGQFPTAPPKLFFVNPIFHPNIGSMDQGGMVCVSSIGSDWQPDFSLAEILQSSLPWLLDNPEERDPVNHDAADVYRSNRSEYIRMVQEGVAAFANDEMAGFGQNED